MKRLSYCALILALLSAPAFAAKNTQNVNFADAVKVGASQLPAGDYKVTWDGTGSSIQVSFEQKGVSHPATATVTAKVEQSKNNRNGFIIDTKNGANTVETLQFTKYNVTFTSTPAPGQ